MSHAYLGSDTVNDETKPNTTAKSLPLGKNLAWGVMGNVVFALTQWLILISLARIGSPEDVGILTIVTAIVTPIFMFGDMAMNDAHTVDDLSEFKRADYFALRIIGALTASVGCVVASYLWYGDQTTIFAAAMALVVVKFIGSQMQLNYGVYQREQRVDLVALSNVTRGIFGLIGFALVFWMTKDLWAALLAQAAVWLLVLRFADRRSLATLGVMNRFGSIFTSNWRTILKLFIWLLPLALTAVLVNATMSAPRLVLASAADLAAVGVFGAIAFIDTGFSVAINAIGFASASRLRTAARNGNRRRFILLSLKLVALTTSIGCVIFLGGWFFGEEILWLLYGTDFVNMSVFILIIGATALRSAFAPLQVALTAGHVLWRRFFINAMAFLFTLVSALILVPDLGALGAAWSFLIGIATRVVLLVVFFIRLAVTMKAAAIVEFKTSRN